MNRLSCSILWLVLILGLAGSATAADKNVFESRPAGISITKPDDWHFLTEQAVAQNLALPRLRDKELTKMIRSKPNIPFLVIAQHPEPYEGLNPSVQVSLRTQGDLVGKGAVALLNRVVERLQGNFVDFEFVQRVSETTVDGQPAAWMSARYSVVDEHGKVFKTLARMWIVPREEYMLAISMYGPAEGVDVLDQAFSRMLQSVRLLPE